MNSFKYLKKLYLFFISFAVCLTIAGCGGGGGAAVSPSSPSGSSATLQSITIALVGNDTDSTTPINSSKLFSDKVLSNSNIYLPIGTQQNIAAYGRYSDDSVKILTSQVKWEFGNKNVINTVTSDGVVVPKSLGSTTVTATLGNISGEVSLIVTSAKLVSISLSPYPDAFESAPVGLSGYYYKAAALYDNGKSSDISTAVTWSSSSPDVATIDAYGLITPVSPGTTKITASYNGFTASLPFTVTNAMLTGITVSSIASSLPLGSTEAFTATGTYTDGTHDITNNVTWNSSNTSIASFDSVILNQLDSPANGSAGTTNITASLGDVISSPFTVNTVSAVLTSVKLQFPPAVNESTILPGTCESFKAIGTYSNGTNNVDISNLVSWSSSDTSVATVDNAGKVCSGNDLSLVGKQFTITAIREAGLSDSVTLTVVSDAITSITLSADQESGVVGVPITFKATGNSGTGNIDVTSDMIWSINGNQIESNVYTPTQSDVADSQPAINVTAITTDSKLSNLPITNNIPALSIYPKQIELWTNGGNFPYGRIVKIFPFDTSKPIPLPITWFTDIYIFANYKDASHMTFLPLDGSSITLTPKDPSMFATFSTPNLCYTGDGNINWNNKNCVIWQPGKPLTAGQTTTITIQDNTDPNKFSETYNVIVDDTKF